MPVSTSYKTAVREWESLLAAVDEHGASLVGAEAVRAALEQALTEAQVVKARQESLTAARQEATQQLGIVVDRGNELVMRLKAAAKLNIGPRSERLVQFGIAPLRRRRRRLPGEVPPPPPPVETAAEAANEP